MTTSISDGQNLSLIRTLNILLEKHNLRSHQDARVYIINALLDCNVNSTLDLTREQWQAFRNAAFPGWPDDDWTLSPTYESKIAAVINQYREQVLGQQRLF